MQALKATIIGSAALSLHGCSSGNETEQKNLRGKSHERNLLKNQVHQLFDEIEGGLPKNDEIKDLKEKFVKGLDNLDTFTNLDGKKAIGQLMKAVLKSDEAKDANKELAGLQKIFVANKEQVTKVAAQVEKIADGVIGEKTNISKFTEGLYKAVGSKKGDIDIQAIFQTLANENNVDIQHMGDDMKKNLHTGIQELKTMVSGAADTFQNKGKMFDQAEATVVNALKSGTK